MIVTRCLAISGLLFAPVAAASGIAQTVGIDGFDYTPATVQIQPGQTVDFTATAFHPLRLDDAPDVLCTQDCNVTYLTPGSYGFYCENHGGPGGSGMAGTVVVLGDPASAPIFVGTFEHTVSGPADPR